MESTGCGAIFGATTAGGVGAGFGAAAASGTTGGVGFGVEIEVTARGLGMTMGGRIWISSG